MTDAVFCGLSTHLRTRGWLRHWMLSQCSGGSQSHEGRSLPLIMKDMLERVSGLDSYYGMVYTYK